MCSNTNSNFKRPYLGNETTNLISAGAKILVWSRAFTYSFMKVASRHYFTLFGLFQAEKKIGKKTIQSISSQNCPIQRENWVGCLGPNFLFEVYSTCVFICKAGGSTMSKMIIPSVQGTNTEIDIYKYTNTQIQNKTFAIFSISWCFKDNKNYIPMCQTHNYKCLAVCIQYKYIF